MGLVSHGSLCCVGIELCGWFSHGSCLQFHVVSVLQVDVHPDDEEEINQTALVLGAPLDQNMEEEEEAVGNALGSCSFSALVSQFIQHFTRHRLSVLR